MDGAVEAVEWCFDSGDAGGMIGIGLHGQLRITSSGLVAEAFTLTPVPAPLPPSDGSGNGDALTPDSCSVERHYTNADVLAMVGEINRLNQRNAELADLVAKAAVTIATLQAEATIERVGYEGSD